ncbi:MAG TPA: FAD-dependent monooxygenase [Ornithinibacter sp.]|nr:FAD-dependent monooxygenase [Ornithinibacter sp.]HQG16263.1 FAD-dependent monooxygenase [Ornithinibacter sp.]
MSPAQVVVIGAGPGGLAAAAALGARGVQALVVDRDSQVGSSWRRHYERLHLHTPRRWSGLPGYRIPRRFGRWVARGRRGRRHRSEQRPVAGPP